MIWKKYLRRTAGVIICILGLFSMLIPLIPGIVLLPIGLYLLSLDSPALKRHLELLYVRYPVFLRIRASYRRLFGRGRDGQE